MLFIKILKWFEELFLIEELCVEVPDGGIKFAKMLFVKFNTLTERAQVGDILRIKFSRAITSLKSKCQGLVPACFDFAGAI